MPKTRFNARTGDRVTIDGARLRGLRESQGLTLADVARAADVSIAVVSQWEHEVSVPGPLGLGGLKRAFGQSLTDSGAVVVVLA